MSIQKLDEEYQPVLKLRSISTRQVSNLEQTQLVFMRPVIDFSAGWFFCTFPGQLLFQGEFPFERHPDKSRFSDPGFPGSMGQPVIEGIAEVDLDLVGSM